MLSMNCKLKIGYYNIHKLNRSKFNQIISLISCGKIDIISISETHFMYHNEFKLHPFFITSTPQSTRKIDGIYLLAHPKYHEYIKVIHLKSNPFFLGFKVGNFSILSCYLPPRFNGSHLESHFHHVQDYEWDIFLGDINIPWLSKSGKKSNSLVHRDKMFLIDNLCAANQLFHIPCGAKLDHIFTKETLQIDMLSYFLFFSMSFIL